ncbi:type II toxin-antitoxin system RelE/ParE family toxin [Streptomyces sp. NPDC060209]|uniref:type II toxin-antitoxin system RelE family toxin n=1 Tax=Streptomyces sp. NPDC060209 TaxID=3347073 RepID=UPI0036643E2D
MDAVDLLADSPRPEGSAEYGAPTLRRMHVGRYRVMYEITDAAVTVIVIHVGRIGWPPDHRDRTASPLGAPRRAGLSIRGGGPGPSRGTARQDDVRP